VHRFLCQREHNNRHQFSTSVRKQRKIIILELFRCPGLAQRPWYCTWGCCDPRSSKCASDHDAIHKGGFRLHSAVTWWPESESGSSVPRLINQRLPRHSKLKSGSALAFSAWLLNYRAPSRRDRCPESGQRGLCSWLCVLAASRRLLAVDTGLQQEETPLQPAVNPIADLTQYQSLNKPRTNKHSAI